MLRPFAAARSRRRSVLLLAAFAGVLPVAAQDAPEEATASPRLEAVRLEPGQRPRIDGRLDEAVWAAAPKASGFVQREPAPGDPATERTEVAVLYDDDALYVAFWAYVRDPSTLIARLARRDESFITDRVSVDIDSYDDGRTAFSFAVTAGGVKQDYLLYDDVQEDVTWDAVWEGEVGRLANAEGAGYTAEYRIPLAQLRYRSGAGPQTWGIQFQRDIPAGGEVTFWAPILPDREGYVSRFGRLEGLAGLDAPRHVELLPYVAGRLTRAPGDDLDPFYDANEVQPNVGFDAKVGLTSNLTLTATVNPDFGQVEADPAVVNLSAFETFFEERRPFFVEGTDIFAFGRTRTSNVGFRPTFFYSRRIGREPLAFERVYPDSGYVFLDSPEQTTIAAAAKVSGKAGPWSVGFLDAVTVEETARFLTTSDTEANLPVEPPANFFVGRVRRDFRGGATVVGGLATAANRSLGGGPFESLLPSAAYVGGLDFEHGWARRRWTVSGVVAVSHVQGGAGAINLLQRSSARYFQRPDQDYLDYDPEATSLGGVHTELSLARTGGAHWRGSLTGTAITPGFELNDLGFQSRADVAALSWFGQYRETRPRRLNFYNVSAYGGWGTNFGGDVVQHYYQASSFVRFTNLWSVYGLGGFRPVYVNDRLTRGGPLALRPADVFGSFELASDARRRVWGILGVDLRRELPHGHDAGLAGVEWARAVGIEIGVRPSDALALSIEPVWTETMNTDQFFARIGDEAATATFGTRYVFADIRQEAFELGFRLDWTFTPDLTLQLYAAPFVAGGRYSGFKEFREPRTFDFDVYGVDRGTITPVLGDDGEVTAYAIDPGDGGDELTLGNGDFNFRSLRGNAVLRWEWRPGSTLFLVWQQTRDEFADYDGFGVVEELGEVFRAPVQNVFLVKATYWLGL